MSMIAISCCHLLLYCNTFCNAQGRIVTLAGEGLHKRTFIREGGGGKKLAVIAATRSLPRLAGAGHRGAAAKEPQSACDESDGFAGQGGDLAGRSWPVGNLCHNRRTANGRASAVGDWRDLCLSVKKANSSCYSGLFASSGRRKREF